MNRFLNLMKLIRWFIYNLLFPLLPMLIAVIIGVLRSSSLSHVDLFNGTELYFLSLTVLASTKNDIDDSDIDLKQKPIYAILEALLLPAIVFTGLIFAVIYIHEKIANLGFSVETIANTGIVTAMFASIYCVFFQLELASQSKVAHQ